MVVESSEVAPDGDRPAGYRVVVTGEIDVASAPALGAKFDELIEAGALLVVLDSSGVEFVDSSGLRALVAASNQLQEAGGQLLIEGMSGAMQKTLEVSGLLERYRNAASS
ncbi:MAG: STAS domain-containing protein [Acidimicrobiia bacterium]|nr:STAS domain-containing protein [Acidimicrobiia bacterium]